MQKHSLDFSQEDLSRLAKDPAVRQLLKNLQESDPHALQTAVSQANQGDLESAKKTISALLEDGQLQSILRHLGR